MAKKPRAAKELGGRYSQAAIAAEIRAAIARKDERGTHKQLSLAMGLESSQQLTHRLSGAYDISVEEAGIAADFFGAPLGWPFIPWSIAEKLTVGKK